MSQDLEDKIVKELLDELESEQMVLPSLPEVALKVRDALESDDVSATDLASVISTDAALTARLIQVANSPLMRSQRKIDSIETAVTRMGNNMVKNVVNGLIVKQIFQPTTEISDKKFREFWQHSTEVAAISHALAGLVRLKPDQAMLAGLIHDIGALPIIKHAEDIPQLLDDETLLDNIIMRAHTQIGKAMLSKWEFPQELIAVAEEHENLQRNHEGAADYVDLIVVANLQSYIGTEHRLATASFSDVPAFAKLGLDTEVSVVDMEDKGESIKDVQAALMG